MTVPDAERWPRLVAWVSEGLCPNCGERMGQTAMRIQQLIGHCLRCDVYAGVEEGTLYLITNHGTVELAVDMRLEYLPPARGLAGTSMMADYFEDNLRPPMRFADGGPR